MFAKQRRPWLVGICVCHWALAATTHAQPHDADRIDSVVSDIDAAVSDIDAAVSDVVQQWSLPYDPDSEARQPSAIATDDQRQVTQTQLLAPQGRPSFRTAQRQQRSRAPSTDSGLSSVPFMIGDTGGGSCGALTFSGTSLASIEHPTFACSRLNIAENNSAQPQDREFFSYRHFHNLSDTEVFGSASAVDSEQFTMGLERLLFRDDLSVEVRVPISRDLNSNVNIVNTPAANNLPLSDRNAEFGNLSVVFKKTLLKRRRSLVSTGVAVNIPTADDIRIRADVDASIAVIPGLVTADADFLFDSLITNDTVNLSPFLAWQHDHHGRWFHQGFLQVDVPLNRSDATVQIAGTIDPTVPPLPVVPLAVDTAGPIDQQTLLRLNLGWGCWLYRGSRCDFLQGIAGLFEVHYTSTLDDANPLLTPVTNIGGFPVDLSIGNALDNIDIVNLTSGVTLDLDGIVVTNGFTAPVTTGANHPFDFEYNLQIQHRY